MEKVAMTDNILIEKDGAVLRFILNNPDHGNEITGEMFDRMLAELKWESDQPTARVLHIRANGSSFCTGRERAGRNPSDVRFETERLVRFKQILRHLPCITVAEVQGDAQGFGFGMAILCDFAIAAEGVSLGFPEIKMGLAPVAIMAYLGEYALPRHAFSLVVTGESIPPQRAVELGLINEAVPAAKLSQRVDEIIQSILALDEKAVRNCKEFFQTALQNNFDQNVRLSIDSLTIGSLGILANQSAK